MNSCLILLAKYSYATVVTVFQIHTSRGTLILNQGDPQYLTLFSSILKTQTCGVKATKLWKSSLKMFLFWMHE